MLNVLLRVGGPNGIGEGLFIIFIFAILCLVVCFVGAKTQHPGIIFCVSLLVFVAVVLILVLIPKSNATAVKEKVTDNNAPFRLAILIILLIIMVGASICWIVQIGMNKIQASRIEQHKDLITGVHYSSGFISIGHRKV